MSRLLFDPARVAGPPETPPTPGPGARGDEPAPLSVTQLAVLINRALRDHLPASVRVVGEIGQFRERTHWYFDVKDAGAVISCVMFASAARRAGFVPQVGQQVVLTGRVEFYDRGGRTQFMVERLEPVGAGALDLAFRKLCEELRGLGWFDEARKRPLPLLPRRVAVVTSRSAAALQDVLDTARRRCPAAPIALVDVRVQGDGAAEQVARAVRRLGRARERLGIDVILVTRGGGSMEDLWAFNDRAVAEAIVKSPVPVVAAIGHETDTTIAELVADLRGATPTQAAMRIFPDAEALRRQLRSMGDRLTLQVSRHVRMDRERLRSASRHPFLADPDAIIAGRRDRLDWAVRHLGAAMRTIAQDVRSGLDRASVRLERHRPEAVYARREAGLRLAAARLRAAMAVRLRRVDLYPASRRLDAAARAMLERRSASLQSAARGLDLVGPPSVLRRGYSITQLGNGRTVRSVSEVSPGQTVTTRLADGRFDSTVSGAGDRVSDRLRTLPTHGARAAAAAPPRRRPAARDAHNPDQLDLFGPGR